MPRQSPSQAAKVKEAGRMRDLRIALGMTQRELAKEFMVTHVSIGLWERGLRTIPGPVLKLMAMFEEKLAAKNKKNRD